MSNQNNVELENGSRFSVSKIWEYQRQYFDNKGIEAWIGNVPYYVTSNSLIAHSYVQMVFRFIQEGVRNGSIDKSEPVYIMELGVGSGRFSYHFMTFFTQLVKTYAADFEFRYVMTDFTETNLGYWQQHSQFIPFIEQGVLDFSIYDVGNSEQLTLKKGNKTITKGSLKNPLVVIANYLFDSVPPDTFKIENGQLHEGLFSIKTAQNNVDKNNNPIELSHLHTGFSFKPTTTDYYDDPILNDILKFYQENLQQSTFLIPLHGINCLNTLASFSHDRLLLVTADKGYTHYRSLENLATPHIAFHGSLSVMVNFDCIGKYFEKKGGHALLATETEGMKVNLLLMGETFADKPDTRWAFNEFGDRFSTKEFLLVKNEMIEHAPELNLQELMALLKLSYWDPDIFVAVASEWANKLGEASRGYLQELRQGMQQIYHNYYFIPNYKNPLFELGHLYHVIGDLEMARTRYEESMEKFGVDTTTLINIGLCYYYQDNKDKSREYLNKALALDPNNESAKEWLGFINE